MKYLNMALRINSCIECPHVLRYATATSHRCALTHARLRLAANLVDPGCPLGQDLPNTMFLLVEQASMAQQRPNGRVNMALTFRHDRHSREPARSLPEVNRGPISDYPASEVPLNAGELAIGTTTYESSPGPSQTEALERLASLREARQQPTTPAPGIMGELDRLEDAVARRHQAETLAAEARRRRDHADALAAAVQTARDNQSDEINIQQIDQAEAEQNWAASTATPAAAPSRPQDHEPLLDQIISDSRADGRGPISRHEAETVATFIETWRRQQPTLTDAEIGADLTFISRRLMAGSSPTHIIAELMDRHNPATIEFINRHRHQLWRFDEVTEIPASELSFIRQRLEAGDDEDGLVVALLFRRNVQAGQLGAPEAPTTAPNPQPATPQPAPNEASAELLDEQENLRHDLENPQQRLEELEANTDQFRRATGAVPTALNRRLQNLTDAIEMRRQRQRDMVAESRLHEIQSPASARDMVIVRGSLLVPLAARRALTRIYQAVRDRENLAVVVNQIAREMHVTARPSAGTQGRLLQRLRDILTDTDAGFDANGMTLRMRESQFNDLQAVITALGLPVFISVAPTAHGESASPQVADSQQASGQENLHSPGNAAGNVGGVIFGHRGGVELDADLMSIPESLTLSEASSVAFIKQSTIKPKSEVKPQVNPFEEV